MCAARGGSRGVCRTTSTSIADCENPLRLSFVEQWSDAAALQAHFAVPESRAFVQALRQLAAAAPELTVYDATPLKL